jgi:transcriptional regulator with XRE-family HTH domain
MQTGFVCWGLYVLCMGSISDLKAKAIITNIRKIREFRDYTQDYLAAKLNISQNAYSKIELGYSSITVARLIQIAEILEIDLAALVSTNSEEIIRYELTLSKQK